MKMSGIKCFINKSSKSIIVTIECYPLRNESTDDEWNSFMENIKNKKIKLANHSTCTFWFSARDYQEVKDTMIPFTQVLQAAIDKINKRQAKIRLLKQNAKSFLEGIGFSVS